MEIRGKLCRKKSLNVSKVENLSTMNNFNHSYSNRLWKPKNRNFRKICETSFEPT